MALQAECDSCESMVPFYELVYIERYDNEPALCHACVNELINRLCDEVVFLHGSEESHFELPRGMR